MRQAILFIINGKKPLSNGFLVFDNQLKDAVLYSMTKKSIPAIERHKNCQVEIRPSDNAIHYAKYHCIDCNVTISWISKKTFENNPVLGTFMSIPVNNFTGDIDVSIKLTQTDRDLIIEALQAVVDYKFQALKPASWQKFNDEYLTSIVDQIERNDFKLNNPQSNPFNWLIDQMCWSKKITEGVPIKDGMPLIDTKLGEQVADVCRAAIKGQAHYDGWRRQTTFRNLFT